MNQYLQQLNNLAAQNEEGDGGDDKSTQPTTGGYQLVKRDGQYVAIKDGREIGRSKDQNAAMQMANSYLRNPPSPVQAAPSDGMAPYAVSEDYGSEQNYPVNTRQLGPDLRPAQPRQPGEFDATPMDPREPSFSTDPAKAVLQGASQTGSAVFGGSIDTDTTGAAPGQEEPQRERRRGGGATWEAPGEAMELSQEDFYTTPGPLEGNYDTGNEYVARSARMPMGALSKAAATLQNRQLELDQKRQAFQEELYKPVKTAAPYQQNFNAIVNKQREDFIQKVAQDLTGGNVNKAYREIFSNPRLRAQYRELNADLEALGQRGAATFEKVINYQNNAATNKIQSTPEQRKLANDIAMGLGGYSAADGTGGSFDKLIKDMNRWDQMEGRDQYFKNTVGPSIKDFFQRIPKEIGWEIKNGRYRLLTEESVKSWDSHIRQLAVDMAVWQGYGDGDLPDEKIQDNINYLTNMLGQQVDREIKVIDTYSNISRGGGDSPKSGRGGPIVGISQNVNPRSNTLYEMSFTPTEYTSGKEKPVSSYPLSRTGGSQPESVAFPRLVWYEPSDPNRQGRFAIEGRLLSVTQRDQLKIVEESPISEDEKEEKRREILTEVERNQPESFDAEANASFLETAYNTRDIYKIVSDALARAGHNFPPDAVREAWKQPANRNKIMEMAKINSAPARGASQPSVASDASGAGETGASGL